MEIELNFRLDSEGRTAPPVTSSPSTRDVTTELDEETIGETKSKEAQTQPQVSINYESRAMMTNLAPPITSISHSDDDRNEYNLLVDELLYDCEITDCGLMPRTFWMPADGSLKPRCSLEQFALNVFNHHVPESLGYDKSKSGAEWWVQIRPSPEGTGRYSMFDSDDDGQNSMSKTGISFHWDKDEDLRLLTGGNTYIFPHLSTVTYLTDLGAPTLILNCRIHNLTGEWIIPGKDSPIQEENVEGFVSWPKAGKHVCFDGRFLHAAPPDLMESGAFERQIKFDTDPSCDDDDEIRKKKLVRRYRRVTFLVNIWLNYSPFEVKPFPESMVDKLSGAREADRRSLDFLEDTTPSHKPATNVRHVTVENSEVARDNATKNSTNESKGCKPIACTWPLGDCGSNETLTAYIPLDAIKKEANNGGNVRIIWNTVTRNGTDNDTGRKPIFGLYRDEPQVKETTELALATSDVIATKRKENPSTTEEAASTSKHCRSEGGSHRDSDGLHRGIENTKASIGNKGSID